MDTWGVVFLGLIALSSLTQTVFLVRLAREGRKVAQRVDEIQERLDREIRPSIENLTRFTRNLGEVSEIVVLQMRRVDAVLADTAEKVQEATSALRSAVVKPLGPLFDVAAVFKGLQRGFAVYQQLRGLHGATRAKGRTYPAVDDEHMFI